MNRLDRPFYQPLIYSFTRFVCLLLYKIFWRLRVSGQENLPDSGPVLIAANHRSFADPPLVGVSTRRRVHFLAKEELFSFKPFGWLISNLNAHPLNRGGKDIAAFKAAKQILSQGDALIVFPEGRRSKTDDFGPAKAGVGMLASMAGCPVIPTYVHNSGWMKSFKPLRVVFGKPLFGKDYPSYQALADGVMGEISRLKTGLETAKI